MHRVFQVSWKKKQPSVMRHPAPYMPVGWNWTNSRSCGSIHQEENKYLDMKTSILLTSGMRITANLKWNPGPCNHCIAISSACMSWGCRKVCSTIALRKHTRIQVNWSKAPFSSTWNPASIGYNIVPLWPELLTQHGIDAMSHLPYSMQLLPGSYLFIKYQ